MSLFGESRSVSVTADAGTATFRREEGKSTLKVHQRPWFRIAAALLLIAVVYGIVTAMSAREVSAVKVLRKPLVATLVINGRVLARSKSEIASSVVGTVRQVLVQEGDRVIAGQPLVLLDDREARAEVAQAESALRESVARLSQTSTTSARSNSEFLAQARLRAKEAEANAERLARLNREGIIPDADAESARRQASIARSEVEAAEVRARSTGSGGADLQVSQAAVSRAREALAVAQARLAQTRIVAPGAGVVLTRSVEPGASASPGQTLLVVTFDSDTWLLGQPDEKNLPQLRLGEPARASADAYPTDSFAASLDYIAPHVDLQRGTVDVKFRVPDPPPYLKTDMTLSIEIETGRRGSTLVVPADAVRDLEAGRPWVMLIDDNRAVRRDIRTGLRGDDVLEVMDGVVEGDVVVTAPVGAVKEGERVAPDFAARKDGR